MLELTELKLTELELCYWNANIPVTHDSTIIYHFISLCLIARNALIKTIFKQVILKQRNRGKIKA